MRILLATDAWEPQVNGVVRTLTRTVQECRAMGHLVEVVSPDQFKTVAMPSYPEIRLAINAYEPMQERFKAFEPEVAAALHHQLPHAVPGISGGPAAGAHLSRLRLHALVPQGLGTGDGGDADHA